MPREIIWRIRHTNEMRSILEVGSEQLQGLKDWRIMQADDK